MPRTISAKKPHSKRPVCRECGGQVKHGNLYCSAKCGHGATSAWTSNAQALKSNGFVADPEIKNVYLKDGVAVTLEHVQHVGLAKALQQHQFAAQARRA